MTDYRAVECALHSAYEPAILRRRWLEMIRLDIHSARLRVVVIPTDLYSRQGEEFRLVTTSDERVEEIRLDRIIRHHATSMCKASGTRRDRGYTGTPSGEEPRHR